MKKMLLITGALTALTLLSSCKVLTGYINASEPLTLVNKQGNRVTISKGTAMKIKMNKEAELKFVLDVNGSRQVIPVSTNFNVKNIRNGDKVFIPKSISGQPYDISGIYKDENSYSQEYDGVESCQISVQERQCRYVDVPNNSCRPGETRCFTGGTRRDYRCDLVTVYIPGERNVRYHYVDNDINFDLNLIKDGKIAGTISSSASSRNKSYTYTGDCRTYRGYGHGYGY